MHISKKQLKGDNVCIRAVIIQLYRRSFRCQLNLVLRNYADSNKPLRLMLMNLQWTLMEQQFFEPMSHCVKHVKVILHVNVLSAEGRSETQNEDNSFNMIYSAAL